MDYLGARPKFGSRIVNFLEQTKLAYLLNFLVLAYVIDVSVSGLFYLYLRWSELSFTNAFSFVQSLVDLHTDSSPFTFSLGGQYDTSAGNHVLILILIGVTAISLIKVKCGKILQWSNFSSLRSGILFAGLFVGFAISIHELLWYVAYVIMGFPNAFYMLSSSMFDYGLVIVILTLFARKLGRNDIMFVGVMGVFYMVWMGLGFHVTDSFSGYTQYLNDFSTNLTEILSWATVAIAAPLIYRNHQGHVSISDEVATVRACEG